MREDIVSNTSSMTTIKAYLSEGSNPETRRFVVTFPRLNPFGALEQKIRQVFPSLSDAHFKLSWKDNDGDTIVMSSDPELSEALANMQNNILKVHIMLTSPEKQEQPQTNSNPRHVHPGITCDMCESEVRGARYKCLQCEDYDMCETCYGKKTHEQHDMLKLVNPSSRPIWAFPGSRRLWKHCVRNQGGKNHHHGWGHRKCPARGPEGTSAENAGHPPQTGGNCNAPPADGFTAARAQYHELLNGIGDTIANLLDPLGINVAYHVDTATRTQTAAEAKTQTEETCPASTDKKDVAGGASTQTEATCPHSSEKRGPATEPMDTTSSPAAVPAAGIPEASAVPMASAPKGTPTTHLYPEMEDHIDTCGWTVLNQEERSDKASASPASLENAAGPRTRIDEALSQMMSMGFTNEGGWLGKLLAVKQGDIEAVLESLNPSRH
ncbi:sequestosome-1-like isoform X2 [Ornithodoros turicata]|uniref:sequestosome-1-like isoform X2 n=1 Tax=Ornithodoros turicata TaxID=34597 RepID=UPI0031391981